MSAMGFLVRWGSMGLGIVLLAGGVQTLATYKPRDEKARPATALDALALATASDDAFIALTASIDPATRVFESCVRTPRFITTDPGRVYDFAVGKAGATDNLLGTTVNITSDLDQARIECQIVLEDSGGQTLQSMRVLAPVAGTAGLVWVVSPRVQSELEADTWQARGSYQGALSRFDDLSTNVSELGYTATQVRDYARDNMGFEIPDNASLVIDGQVHGGTPIWYAAVEGTGGNLVVRDHGDPAATAFTGLVDASARDMDLAATMGADPEALVVVDTSRTAASENARDISAMQVGLIGGTLCFGFGASTTWFKHTMKKRRRERALAAAATLSPAHAMALGIPMPGSRGGTPNPYQPAHGSSAYAIPAPRNTPSMRPQPLPPVTGEDAALEAEMARWTNGQNAQAEESTRKVA